GKDQKIAIIVAYGSPTIKEDFKVFNEKYNLKSTKLHILYPDGKPTTTSPNWANETSLDVEWVHALAPEANIMLVVAKSDSIDDLMNAVDYASKVDAHVISMSWGCYEFQEMSTYESHFEQPNTVYIAATGDSGTGVQWPAVSPNILAVGGTTLVLNPNGFLTKQETAWYASGGGISSYQSEPEYQKEYGINSNNYRTVPDVSFCADPSNGVSIYSSATGWASVCGTSFGSPAWSAFIAIVNQNRNTPLSNIHNKLYQLAEGENYSSNFRDIVSGSNGADILNYAHDGYDYVTGLGSPLEDNLYDSLID
ncbi:S53 family peptidase, partial [Clostridium sp.]|uniref:S53 family peptidase n=1 Tax=Clostridium sp. TaxID=1506 RepID=UPI003EE96A33